MEVVELFQFQFLFFILSRSVLSFCLPGLFEWLWNITIPQVFNLKTITYWQAFRLLLIAGILFGPARIVMGR